MASLLRWPGPWTLAGLLLGACILFILACWWLTRGLHVEVERLDARQHRVTVRGIPGTACLFVYAAGRKEVNRFKRSIQQDGRLVMLFDDLDEEAAARIAAYRYRYNQTYEWLRHPRLVPGPDGAVEDLVLTVTMVDLEGSTSLREPNRP